MGRLPLLVVLVLTAWLGVVPVVRCTSPDGCTHVDALAAHTHDHGHDHDDGPHEPCDADHEAPDAWDVERQVTGWRFEGVALPPPDGATSSLVLPAPTAPPEVPPRPAPRPPTDFEARSLARLR